MMEARSSITFYSALIHIDIAGKYNAWCGRDCIVDSSCFFCAHVDLPLILACDDIFTPQIYRRGLQHSKSARTIGHGCLVLIHLGDCVVPIQHGCMVANCLAAIYHLPSTIIHVSRCGCLVDTVVVGVYCKQYAMVRLVLRKYKHWIQCNNQLVGLHV